MHQVVVAQLAAARQGTHSAKTRGEVSGGGKKPYRQKGTGRARQGSTRAPQFAGGGVSHGPVPARVQPAHPEEDEGRRAARCPLRPGPRRSACTCCPRWSTATPRRPRPLLAAIAAVSTAKNGSSSWSPARTRSAGEPAQRRRGAPDHRRPAEHLRRAGQRRRGLHPRRAGRVPAFSMPPRPSQVEVVEDRGVEAGSRPSQAGEEGRQGRGRRRRPTVLDEADADVDEADARVEADAAKSRRCRRCREPTPSVDEADAAEDADADADAEADDADDAEEEESK